MPRLVVISWSTWIIFIITFLLLIALVLWAFLGYIPIIVKGKGMIISQSGLSLVQARISGTINDLKVKPGDQVKKNDILMNIYDPQLELQFQGTKTKVDMLREQVNYLKKQIAKEAKAKTEAVQTKIKATQFNIRQIRDDINFLTTDLEKGRKLLQEGLISGVMFHTLERTVMQRKIELEEKQGQLAVLNSELHKEYRPEELRDKEHQLLNEEEQLNLLRESLEDRIVYSPQDGKILELLINSGQLVQIGSPLVWMENVVQEKKPALIYGYFPIEMGKRIRIGTPIEMTVAAINPNIYGAIRGKVADVSLFAVSHENIFNKIHNKAIIDYLTNQTSAVIQVIVEPEYDPRHPSQFRWTSGKTPPHPISTGTVGEMEATVEKIRPIFYLLPLQSLKNYQDQEQRISNMD